MSHLRIERVAGDYRPGYPRRLSPAEYEALMRCDRDRRVLAAAAAASVTFATALAAQEGGSGREDRVLTLLSRSAAGPSSWIEHAAFRRGKDAHGVPWVTPQIPISFGNSHNGLFDAGRARALARELFHVYGLKPRTDHDLAAEGTAARLDLYDPAVQVGCKLRGRMPAEVRMSGRAEPEEPAHALDDEELAKLAASGHRIQAVDLDAFPLMDGDQFTPTLAYLGGIVAFLNEVTGGPDIDLGAILERHEVRQPLALPGKAPAGVRIDGQPGGGWIVHADAAADLVLAAGGARAERRVPPPAGRGPADWQPTELRDGVDGPMLLRLVMHPGTAMVVSQDGADAVRIAAAGTIAFLPQRFDPRRPFTLTLRLTPGQHVVPGHVVLGGVAP